jgi:hypothetical protein
MSWFFGEEMNVSIGLCYVGNQGVDRRGQRLGGINLKPEDYEEMTALLCNVVGSCGGRVAGAYTRPLLDST